MAKQVFVPDYSCIVRETKEALRLLRTGKHLYYPDLWAKEIARQQAVRIRELKAVCKGYFLMAK